MALDGVFAQAGTGSARYRRPISRQPGARVPCAPNASMPPVTEPLTRWW
ncbi:hypothetical protein SAMN04487818_11632 [Actinokineospora terrae]|uniref:Uncharacterized protein n=2 Tax=Actinokineospora terrae TaxID=155974 RepID=A0A1H9XKA2_9PSEU|nr:hypothetical protein SAMN04487818_11632 [Actinokineospora terrae]